MVASSVFHEDLVTASWAIIGAVPVGAFIDFLVKRALHISGALEAVFVPNADTVPLAFRGAISADGKDSEAKPTPFTDDGRWGCDVGTILPPPNPGAVFVAEKKQGFVVAIIHSKDVMEFLSILQ